MLDTLDVIDYDNYMTNAEIEEMAPVDDFADFDNMTDETWAEYDRMGG